MTDVNFIPRFYPKASFGHVKKRNRLLNTHRGAHADEYPQIKSYIHTGT